VSRQWRFSRKSRDWQAYGKLRITRDQTMARTERLVTKHGRLVRDRERSWEVEFDDEEGRFYVSKEHGTRDDDTTWSMPEWLWEKMAEEGGR
jgi:hypothetical protein